MIDNNSYPNYDIRGARGNFNDNTRGQRGGMQPGYEVAMPQGESPFVDLGGKKHFTGQPGEIKQQRSLEHPYDLPNSYEFSMPYYPRSLNVRDIEGTNPGTLVSKAVIKQGQAKKLIEEERAQDEAANNNNNQVDPYSAYQDALDKFKSQINGGGYPSGQSGKNFKDRHQIQARGNIEDPYARNDDPRYKNRMENDASRWEDSIYEQKTQPTQPDYERYQSDIKNNSNNYQQSQQQQNRDSYNNYQQFQQQQQQQQYQGPSYQSPKYQQNGNRNPEPSQQYQQPPQAPQGSSFSKNSYHNAQQQQQYPSSNQDQVPPENNSYSKMNSYQSSPQLLTQSQVQQQYNKFNPSNKLTQQSEIINHAMNNISPQITKQQLGPNILNVDGYVANRQDGTRLNPTSMSYGAPSSNQNLIMHHSLLGNQIYSSPQDIYPTRLPHTRDGRITGNYFHPSLNIEKFEKFPGEMASPQGSMPATTTKTKKNVTNASIFTLPQRAAAPKSEMGDIMKSTFTQRLPNERNLESYKRDNTNRIPTFNDPRNESRVRFQDESNNNSRINNSNSLGSTMSKLAARPLPFGAPFSYNPNEFRKADMVSLNHQKLLEKIEHSIDVNDSNLEAIEHAVPEIQQPHIKKTLNQQSYEQFLSENDLVLQKELERQYGQKASAPYQAGIMNNYGNGRNSQQYVQESERQRQQQQAQEFLAKHGAKALRNLSNVKIF